MMCWNWIDSSRKREAPTIPCPGPGIASLRRCTAGPGQKIAKTTPCKVERTPARSPHAALRPGIDWRGDQPWRIDDDRNMARFYKLDAQPTLFGEWSLVREWGRTGQAGSVTVEIHRTRGIADIALISK